MTAYKNLVRVILRSDGSVHTVFRDIRSIVATPQNLMELISDPISFIEKGSHTYQDSTFLVNRNRVELEDVLGLTLLAVDSDKVVSCNFPELFQYIFTNIDSEKKNLPLNMQDFEHRSMLSDEKSFLLKYYLEFTRNLRTRVGIEKNIKLRNEVQVAIMREILNAYFEEELPKPTKAVDLSRQIDLGESEVVYKEEPKDPMANMVSVTEYAKLTGWNPDTVRRYIRENKLKKVIKNGNFYLIDRDDRPPEYDKRRGKKRKKTGEEKFFRRAVDGSPEEVRSFIRDKNYYSDEVGKYIRTYAELDYYVKHTYHETVFNGRHCLILDVNPDYIVPENMVPQKVISKNKDGDKTIYRNRDLMQAGCAPVIPFKQKDQFRYHVHHIGQKGNDSPFCIIPEYDHNSKELSSVFHQGSYNTELNRLEFDVQKSSFWKEFIRQYDKAKDFNKIPYHTRKHAQRAK